MTGHRAVIGGLVLLAAAATSGAAAKGSVDKKTDPALQWPEVRRETRPWTRWWWLGSAVNEQEITRHLEEFGKAGFGGVEISPIYGVQGAESRNIPYLSPRWVEMLRHTTREGRRLGLGVDMILGTGWPYGGSTVSREDSASQLVVSKLVPGIDGTTTIPTVRGGRLYTLMAYGPSGEIEELTARAGSGGKVDWKAPGTDWSLYSVHVKPTGQQVKRAGPGGEGPVLDPFGGPALQRWLGNFTPVLEGMPSVERPRALFNDSFEAFGANWTPELFAQFQRRRGYDLHRFLPALKGDDTPDRVQRVRSDYRQTVSDLLLESFTRPWTAWARGRNCATRNQAHGSPGNLIDLYAAADIPETEMFGPVRVKRGVDGAAASAEIPIRDILTSKIAASAAHVAGKPYVSSESMTWLAEHFQGPLSEVKDQANQLFLSGVNHLYYHGSPFSPADAEWPGWLFYASTHFAPSNTWWRDLSTLNGYLTRCQSFLQAGRPDNDVLVYFPIWDLWAKDEGSRDLLQAMTVHSADVWREKNLLGFDEASRELWRRGSGFDYVSDELLQQIVSVSDGKLVGRNGTYRVLLLAGCERMPPETLEKIARFAREGATVAILDQPPSDVPGLADLEARRAALRAAVQSLGVPSTAGRGVHDVKVGQGRVLMSRSLEFLLKAAGDRVERAQTMGVSMVRRVHEHWIDYFVVNQGAGDVSRWLPVKAPARAVVIFDPMTGVRGLGDFRKGLFSGETDVRLDIEPGGSRVLRILNRSLEGPRWAYAGRYGPGHELKGDWHLEFVKGGPSLPAPLRASRLQSWTELPGDPAALRAFSGTVRYRLTFDRPGNAGQAWTLDLGDVRHSARVRLNDQDLGTLIAPPFRQELPGLRERGNVLEVEVTNLMANRIADLDRRKVLWQKFFFVNHDYKKFDASTWEPLPSGILGPARLLPHLTSSR